MIDVTKSESKMLRKKFPKLHIAKTKHKYAVPEEYEVMRALPNNSAARAIVAATNKKYRGENH